MPELTTETYGSERHGDDDGSRASSRRLDVPGTGQLRCKAIRFAGRIGRRAWQVACWLDSDPLPFELDGQDLHRYKSARLRVPMPGIQEGSR